MIFIVFTKIDGVYWEVQNTLICYEILRSEVYENSKEKSNATSICCIAFRAPDRAQTNTFYLIDFEKFIQIKFPKLQKFLQNRFNERWLI